MPSRAAILLGAVVLALSACGRTQPLRYASDGGDELRSDCEPWGEDSFTLPPMERRPVDVLLVIDDSGSMRNDQSVLASNFQAFISRFRAHQLDFHLGAVTTDMRSSTRSGRLVAPYLTPQTTNLEAAFQQMVNVGTRGSAREQGLAATRAALSEPLTSNDNRGFLRPSADLAVLYVADEDDQSTGTVAEFSGFLRGLKQRPDTVTVAAILDMRWYLGCDATKSSWRFVALARSFGPRGFVSTCTSDYTSTLEAVSSRIAYSPCIVPLRRRLDPEVRISVQVNGEPAEYLYRPPDEQYGEGSIEVQPCPPEGGTVRIEYQSCRE
ncbi:MAG: VWA domain-containing protein [Myxococcales bacterium]|nr:VWA domain-containing protein [Myxococcales bacterium]